MGRAMLRREEGRLGDGVERRTKDARAVEVVLRSHAPPPHLPPSYVKEGNSGVPLSFRF